MSSFPINECRVLYSIAAEKESAAMHLLNITADWKEKEPLAEAYWGVAKMVLAKFAFFPLKKLSLFQAGKQALQHAILHQPNVTELRFLRLSIQKSVPSILAYQENIEEDKAFILKHIENEAEAIQIAFKTFCQRYDV